MRERFYALAAEQLDANERLAVVAADIGAAQLRGAARRHPSRVVNVGIREQLLIGVTAGLALEGLRPVAHSYAPFLVERPFEQIKLDLGHQDVGAVLVSIAASYDAAEEGRTHQSPGDVALLSTLPGWTIFAPGHPAEAEAQLRRAFDGDGRVYVRLTVEENPEPIAADGLVVVREGSESAPLVLAVGPTLGETLAATADLDVTVAYTSRPRPLDRRSLRALVRTGDIVLVEPYLAGTSAAEIARSLRDRPHRLLALGVGDSELRRYGTPAEHRRAHGLDAVGIRRSLAAFL
jgi:transketolase